MAMTERPGGFEMASKTTRLRTPRLGTSRTPIALGGVGALLCLLFQELDDEVWLTAFGKAAAYPAISQGAERPLGRLQQAWQSQG